MVEVHHQEAIEQFVRLQQSDETILAILLGGSLAHGFAAPDADIDLLIIVEAAEYQKRKAAHKLAFSRWDLCNYPGGYIDCKVLSLDFLDALRARGSDPARYAFKDSIILFSRLYHLSTLLAEIARFPMEDQAERRRRFAAQLLAWRWYYSEAVKKENQYLFYLAIQKIVLFSCRLVLNENQMLYPYHKWLLKVVETAPLKPKAFDQALAKLLVAHNLNEVNQFSRDILDFVGLEEKNLDWANQFMIDNELNWMEHEAPVDDL